ncbi:PaaI family thioesterase [Paraburkholderia sp. J11-2]|uniref:PaaI family thioesterase n=1 Tax=Paraburkholderia sp. J11-2 TaxID=2805431 RepID=UPI002AB74366|nr:PaaI family thioesterase [Paraburkholderia sp. J11-2]
MSEARDILTIEQIQQAFDRSPYIASLRMRVTGADHEAQALRVHIPFQPGFERGAGTGQWHGGPLAAIIDTVGDFAVGMLVGRGLPTINFCVDYLRPAIETGIEAVATVRRLGRSVSVADVELYNDKGVLLAIGRASYATA